MGTTVATNALLERKGDARCCSSPKVSGDALRIGYQAARGISTRKSSSRNCSMSASIEIPGTRRCRRHRDRRLLTKHGRRAAGRP
jgi:N-methylhydantoinase A/oxoprolinase/acetone carboxylase beta subunit